MKTSPATPDSEDIFPEGVELFRLDDVSAGRQDIYNKAKSALTEAFPRTYAGVTLELQNLEYIDPETYTPAQERQALLEGDKMSRRLRGEVILKDAETGEVLDQTKKTLMHVPYLGHRGTFIHNGSHYTSSMQSRLQPGVFSRRRANGELETHYNVAPGTGRPFRITFDPESTMFRFNIGGSSLKLYSILRDLGVDDETMREAWGDEVYAANRDKYDRQDINKLFSKLYPYEEKDIDQSVKLDMLREKLFSSKVSRDIVRRTLGTHQDDDE